MASKTKSKSTASTVSSWWAERSKMLASLKPKPARVRPKPIKVKAKAKGIKAKKPVKGKKTTKAKKGKAKKAK